MSLALAEVVAHAGGLTTADAAEVRAWHALAEADAAPLYPLREAAGAARELGADTETVLASL